MHHSDLNARPPGRIATILGIAFQADASSSMVTHVIRPFQALNRLAIGIRVTDDVRLLSNHVGIHVLLEDGQQFIVEQLPGTPEADVRDGLNWNPIERFRARDRGGWNVTVPLPAFRGINDAVMCDTVARLNIIDHRPFLEEDCTQFVERACGNRRLFADSPVLSRLGIHARLGDPALPLLRRDVELDHEIERRLQVDMLRELPDAEAQPGSTSVLVWERWLTKPLVYALSWAIVAGLMLHLHSECSESIHRSHGFFPLSAVSRDKSRTDSGSPNH